MAAAPGPTGWDAACRLLGPAAGARCEWAKAEALLGWLEEVASPQTRLTHIVEPPLLAAHFQAACRLRRLVAAQVVAAAAGARQAPLAAQVAVVAAAGACVPLTTLCPPNDLRARQAPLAAAAIFIPDSGLSMHGQDTSQEVAHPRHGGVAAGFPA